MNDDLQQQLIQDLLIESFEGLEQFDQLMLALEKGDSDAETMNQIFRVIHTIKGTSGCIGLSKIESVAHVGENLLSLLRDGKLTVTSDMITALLALSDALGEMLTSLEQTGNEGDADYTDLKTRLQDLQTPGDAPPKAKTKSPRKKRKNAKKTAAAAAPAEPEPPKAAEPAFGLFAEEEEEETAAFGLFDEEEDVAPTPVPVADAATPEPATATAESPEKASRSSVSESVVRVGVEQLDKLMNLVGELVLARNQIVQYTGTVGDPTVVNASQRLNLITTELQERVMKTRMQPVSNIWAKYPRIVRDLAKDLGKQVELIMDGQDTELDRTIIEAIKDPLTHIIRNAVDHGMETTAEREAVGKPGKGLLMLRAFHEGGQVNIEITDDGGGVHVERVKQKAIEKGIINAEQAQRMGHREACNLIFSPGFSTAAKVTNVSGRGVGMDVVKTNIEKIGGSVDIATEPGKSTSVKIKIPLTLAIIPALVVTSGSERFAIPQVNLVELVRLESEHAAASIETIYGAPVYRLRGNLLTLVYLNKEMQLTEMAAEDVHDSEAVNIVVLQADGRQFGLVVDEVNDTEEIVVKPLGKQLKGLSFFAGATIMGDGRVALILDVLGLAQQAHVVSESRDGGVLEEKTGTYEAIDEKETLLLFNNGEDTRLAISLATVDRLEEIARDRVETTGGQDVVQYRGQIMPLVRVGDYLPRCTVAEPDPEAPLQVVVYSESGHSVGLVVGGINDIVEESLNVKRDNCGEGLLGSAVIQDRVTDLIDVKSIVRSANPSFREEALAS